MAEPERDDDRAVDEDGNPTTPAKQAIDKRKKRNLTYAGLALGAIGVVVAIVTLRKNASSSSSSVAPVPSFGTDPTGMLAGSSSPGSSSGDPFASLESQLATQNAQQLAATRSLQTALARLTAELHATGGHNAGDQTRAAPKVNASNYAAVLAKGAKVDIIGEETSKGYVGANIRGGAPVYAFLNGQWRQGTTPAKAPAGTLFATLPQFGNKTYEVGQPVIAPVASPPHA